MSPDIRTVFPQQNLSADTVLCKIVIRHGFRSDSRPFVPLQSEIQLRFGGAVVDNVSYPWKDHVILNGLRTAVTLVEALDSDLPIVLIGHSMGGLVCRIANLALTRTADVQKEVFRSAWSSTKPKFVEAKQLAKRLRPRTVRGVATLATPNSATLTLGQTASALKPVHFLVRHGFPNKAASFADLTTSGLFRRFQDFESKTPTLSISGSSTSRFGTIASGAGIALGFASSLALPNDGVVEDRSVDLRQSVLPNEVYRFGGAPYTHHRTYRNCDQVTHSDIYDDAGARELLFDFIARIL
jgi:pimeloyl-ACP methyl ester carboxylesterase